MPKTFTEGRKIALSKKEYFKKLRKIKGRRRCIDSTITSIIKSEKKK